MEARMSPYSSIVDRLDLIPLSAGVSVGTLGGALSLADWQSIVGVVAGIFGIILTVVTIVCRLREHRWRIRAEGRLTRQQQKRDYQDDPCPQDEN